LDAFYKVNHRRRRGRNSYGLRARLRGRDNTGAGYAMLQFDALLVTGPHGRGLL
jgi:hypothetical protein